MLLGLVLGACGGSPKIFRDYELSYSRSGGESPFYENVFVKGETLYYFYQKGKERYRRKAAVSAEEKRALYEAVERNRLAGVREDHKKFYNHLTTSIKVRLADRTVFRDNGSGIRAEDAARWANVVAAFEGFIESKNIRKP